MNILKMSRQWNEYCACKCPSNNKLRNSDKFPVSVLINKKKKGNKQSNCSSRSRLFRLLSSLFQLFQIVPTSFIMLAGNNFLIRCILHSQWWLCTCACPSLLLVINLFQSFSFLLGQSAGSSRSSRIFFLRNLGTRAELCPFWILWRYGTTVVV
jgi:hypothetical protein